MLDQISRFVDAPARFLMAPIFIIPGLSKIGAFEATQGYMEAFGVPGMLLAPTIAFEIGAGVLLLFGLWTRYLAILLAGFSILTALIFHMNFADQSQLLNFLKNLAMAGGFLLLAKSDAPGLSVDAWLATRKGTS